MKLRQIIIDGNVGFVPLTKGLYATVDAADADLVGAFNWCAQVGPSNTYAVRNYKNDRGGLTMVLMHRLILGVEAGFVDHRDGNGLDNRRSNIRPATIGENARNARIRSDNTSGYKGVSFHKVTGRWSATIAINGKSKHLGLFGTPEEAHAVYCVAAKEMHGDFARTG